MPATLDPNNGFVPTTVLASGKKGLKRPQGSVSTATLNGTGLTNGLPVTILHPPQSHNPQVCWTGTTANSNSTNTQCTVDLTEQHQGPERPPRDDDTTVSVTAGDSNTITPTVPVGP
jgi:hypothetical protein